MRALRIDASKCTACRRCELACSWHLTGVFNPAKSAIRVSVFDTLAKYVPFTCFQCKEAWCMRSCPTIAISISSLTGAKIVDDGSCVGCKVCTVACPFGTINFNSDTGKVYKCDLCDGDPSCVDICPTNAILYSDEDTANASKMNQWALKLTDAYSVREVSL